MNLLQYINKIFCAVLVFATGHETYSQREIHPLEPMFTYDYALKYYSTQSVKISAYEGYWHIENFKAPIKVSKITEYDYPNRFLFNYGTYLTRSTWLIKKDLEQHSIWKTEHYFDPKTNYLQKTVLYNIEKKNKSIIDTLEIKTYKYNIDKSHTTIRITKTLFPQRGVPNKIFNRADYTYKNLTGDLIATVLNGDTITFNYKDSEITVQKKINTTDSLFMIKSYLDCDNYSDVDVTEYLGKKNIEKFFSSSSVMCYEVFGKNGSISSNSLKFKKDSLFYYSKRFDGAYITNIAVFDKDKKVKEFYEFTTRPSRPLNEYGFVKKPDMSNPDTAALYNGFSAINLKHSDTKTWELNFINKIGEYTHEFTVRKRGEFYMEKGNIYFMNEPVIIYEFD